MGLFFSRYSRRWQRLLWCQLRPVLILQHRRNPMDLLQTFCLDFFLCMGQTRNVIESVLNINWEREWDANRFATMSTIWMSMDDRRVARQSHKVHSRADARISDSVMQLQCSRVIFFFLILFWLRGASDSVGISMFIFTLDRVHAFRMAHLIWFTTNCNLQMRAKREHISVTFVMPMKNKFPLTSTLRRHIDYNRNNNCNNLWNLNKIDERNATEWTK